MSRIKSDERVIFFPTTARLSDDGKSWLVPIHGWIFEPEEKDYLRGLLINELQEWLPQGTTEDERRLFDQRLRWFLVDNERGKRIAITVNGQLHLLPTSTPDGHFNDLLNIPVSIIDQIARDGRFTFRAVTDAQDQRVFEGTVYLLYPHGLSVISDIDDTIKISEVSDRRRLLKNTLMRPFAPVEGMADVYNEWAAHGAHFHFVSMSPWQLYKPLTEFAATSGFPDGIYYLRRFRVKDTSFWNLFTDPQAAKSVVIEQIIAHYPQRHFVLVGDTSQKDPELYGQIARMYPDRVQHIFIRRVPDVPTEPARFDACFAGIPREKWNLFTSASELPRDVR